MLFMLIIWGTPSLTFSAKPPAKTGAMCRHQHFLRADTGDTVSLNRVSVIGPLQRRSGPSLLRPDYYSSGSEAAVHLAVASFCSQFNSPTYLGGNWCRW